MDDPGCHNSDALSFSQTQALKAVNNFFSFPFFPFVMGQHRLLTSDNTCNITVETKLQYLLHHVLIWLKYDVWLPNKSRKIGLESWFYHSKY